MSGPVDEASLHRFLASAVDVGDPAASALRAFEATLAGVRGGPLGPGDAVLLVGRDGLGTVGGFLALLEAGLVPAVHGPAAPERLHEVATALECAAVVEVSSSAGRPRVQVRSLPGVGAHTSYQVGEAVLLTSGTAGIATGCVHAVDSLYENARRHLASLEVRGGPRTLVTLPLSYSFALVAQALAACRSGGSIVVAPPPFTAAGFTESLVRYDIESTALTPWFVQELLGGRWRAPRSLRTLSVGGSELGAGDVRRLRDRCGSTRLAITYGLSEAGPRVSTLLTDRVDDARLGSVGRPIEGVSVVAPTETWTESELVITTDTAMRRRAGRARLDVQEGGLLRTGDVFVTDPDGFLYFRSRARDVILHRGGKLNLRSVRRLVETVPGVSFCRTRETAEGYELVVYVSESQSLSETDVRHAVLRRLAHRERPSTTTVDVADRPHK